MDDKERLEHFEQMLSHIESEYESVESQVDSMMSEGKSKTATFKQLLARKLTLRQFLDAYARHGLR